jgi:hypothetical protein
MNVAYYDATVVLRYSVRRAEILVRDGAEYFTVPAGAAQRRYEALRAYFLDEMPAAEVADRFRLLHRQRAPDGHAAAQGKAGPVH